MVLFNANTPFFIVSAARAVRCPRGSAAKSGCLSAALTCARFAACGKRKSYDGIRHKSKGFFHFSVLSVPLNMPPGKLTAFCCHLRYGLMALRLCPRVCGFFASPFFIVYLRLCFLRPQPPLDGFCLSDAFPPSVPARSGLTECGCFAFVKPAYKFRTGCIFRFCTKPVFFYPVNAAFVPHRFAFCPAAK